MPAADGSIKQPTTSSRDNELRAWALFTILIANFLLQLFGAEWNKIDEAGLL